jgi:hypothetical protein
MVEIEHQIAATPGGPKALAIKTYLWHRVELSNWVPDGAVVRFPELFKEDGEAWRDNLTVSTFRDAAKQVPELAELFAPIIHEDAPLIDAEIIVQWCEQIALRNEHRDCRADAAEQLSEALDRIERIPAKTARGEAIKARHAANIIEYPDNRLNKMRLNVLASAVGTTAAPTTPAPDDPIFALIAQEAHWRSLAAIEREKAEKAVTRQGLRWSENEDHPLFEETNRLEEIASELFDRIVDTPASTLHGILAKLEFEADSGDRIVDAAIADLRRWLGDRS